MFNWHIMFKFWIVLPFICIACSVEAKVARLVTFPIPLMVEGKDKGAFINLTNEIANRNSTKFEVDIVTSNKAQLQFSNGLAQGYFPGMDNSVPKDALRTTPFYVRVNFIFYREGKSFRTLKALHGKSVGLTFRYHYPSEITDDTKINFSFADDDVSNMKRLAEGTIDAFIAEERSGLRALELSKAKGITYSKDNPVSSQDCYFAFKNDGTGKILLQEFNATLEKMKEDGSLDKVLNISEPPSIKKL